VELLQAGEYITPQNSENNCGGGFKGWCTPPPYGQVFKINFIGKPLKSMDLQKHFRAVKCKSIK